MGLWVDGSRACRGCGATVVDELRSVHESFHAALEPSESTGTPIAPTDPSTDAVAASTDPQWPDLPQAPAVPAPRPKDSKKD